MLAHGAEQVLIDGAIDRRAASSPDVADGLVMSTGAVLSEDIEEVVERTARRRRAGAAATADRDTPAAAALHELLAGAVGTGCAASTRTAHHELPQRFVPERRAAALASLLREHPSAHRSSWRGRCRSAFSTRCYAPRRRRELPHLVVADPTRVFLAPRASASIAARAPRSRRCARSTLRALTVNPAAPRSHEFDSRRLRARSPRRSRTCRSSRCDAPDY